MPLPIAIDIGGQQAPLVLDLSVTSEAATVSGSTDISIDQAVAAVVVNGILSINVSQSDTFKVTLTSDLSGIIFDGWPTNGFSKRVAIYFVQDQTGGHVVAWPASIKWSSGVPHALSMSPLAIDCFVFGTFDSGVTVFGNAVGFAYA